MTCAGYPDPRVPSNNAMHQTRREGAAGAFGRRPVVEARLAGDCGCSTHRGVDRGTKCIGSPDSAVRRRKPGMSPGPSLLRQCERHDSKRATSLDPRPGALSVFRLGSMIDHRNPRRKVGRMRVVTQGRGAQNNGLHQTGREGVAHFVRRGPVVEARPAGEAGCSTHRGGARSTACMGTPDSAIRNSGGANKGQDLPSAGSTVSMAPRGATSLDPRLAVLSVFRLGCMIDHRNPGVR